MPVLVCCLSLAAILCCHFLHAHAFFGTFLLCVNLSSGLVVVIAGQALANPFHWYLLSWDAVFAMYYSDILLYHSHLLDAKSEWYLILCVIVGAAGYYFRRPPGRKTASSSVTAQGREY